MIIDHFDYPETGGIFVWYKDVPYPVKGFPTPEAINAINIAKRILRGHSRFFANKETIKSFATFGFLSYKNKLKVIEEWMDAYYYSCKVFLIKHYLKPRYYGDFAKELSILLNRIFKEIGLDPLIYPKFTEIVMFIMEYDSAYRYRIEDILSETTLEKIQNDPKQEIGRLLDIFFAREPKQHLRDKFNLFVQPILWALKIPSINKAFRRALEGTDLTKLQLDDADRYWVSNLSGYDFFGQTIDERMVKYQEIHKGNLPQRIKINYYENTA